MLMSRLTDAEKKTLCALIETGEPLPEKWRYRLFPGAARSQEIGKEYRLEYAGKMKREEVLAQTLAAPWQLVRSFCSDGSRWIAAMRAVPLNFGLTLPRKWVMFLP